MAKRRNKKTKSKSKSPKVEVAPDVQAPDALRRLLRFGQLGVANASQRNPADIFNLVVTELRDSGVPDEAIALIEEQGPDFLKSSRIRQSIAKAAGGKPNLDVIKDSLRLGRAATVGVSEKVLASEFDDVLKLMAEIGGDDPATRAALDEIRKLGPKTLSKVGAGVTVAAVERRGSDPPLQQLYTKLSKKAPSPTIAKGITEVVKKAEGGSLPKVSGAARSTLAQGGLKGVGRGASLLRGASRVAGSSLPGLAINAAILGASTLPGVVSRLGREDRSKALAQQGFAQLGPSSNVEFLKDMVDKQEAVSRRRLVMQQFEPEMMQQVVRALAGQTDSGRTLTSSESRIGSPVGDQFQGRKSAKEVQFLLDRLLEQAGNLG